MKKDPRIMRMKWLDDLRARLQGGHPLDPKTALWLLDAIEWQRKQMGYAFEAILNNCERFSTGPSGNEAWYSDSDAEDFMTPTDDPGIDLGPR